VPVSVFPITNETIREPTRPFVNTFHKTTKKKRPSQLLSTGWQLNKKNVLLLLLLFLLLLLLLSLLIYYCKSGSNWIWNVEWTIVSSCQPIGGRVWKRKSAHEPHKKNTTRWEKKTRKKQTKQKYYSQPIVKWLYSAHFPTLPSNFSTVIQLQMTKCLFL